MPNKSKCKLLHKKCKLHKVASLFLLALILIPNTLKAHAGVTPPTTALVKTPPISNGKNGWYVTPVTLELNATDLESGVKTINYKVDSQNWTTITYANTLNLAPNPSFETSDSGSNIYTLNWKSDNDDGFSTITHDSTIFAPGFSTSSIKIVSTSTTWHSVNHSNNYSTTTPFSNMTASAWIKSENSTGDAYFTIYVVSEDLLGNPVYTPLSSSPIVTATADWTQVKLDFVVNQIDAIGVYMDVGLEGEGAIWIDAVNISESMSAATTTFAVASDGSHTVQYYSTDNAENIETTKSTSFKIDQTPPGNWHNSGAYRGWFSADYQLWVYTNVIDGTSGISTFTDKYQYHTELKPGFGRYDNISSCTSSWEEDNWVILITPPFWPGSKDVYLLTPRTSFCNSNWNICKVVRFYAEDMAGNVAIKEFCINGPWVKIRGEGIVGAKGDIDMLSEADGDNTDGLIETETNTVDFFTSSKDWYMKNTSELKNYGYNTLFEMAKNKQGLGSNLPTEDGSFYTNANLTLTSSIIPSDYPTSNLEQVILVNGDLTIETNINISDQSAVLFVVSGNVYIDVGVTEIEAGIFTDGEFKTAYNLVEGDASETLVLKGIYTANKFVFQRTLQGTDNSDIASEEFLYEPKYVIKLRDFLGENSVQWLETE